MDFKVFRANDTESPRYNDTLKFWSNALGELHCRGEHSITEEELPDELKRAYRELWTDNCGSLCYLVETSDGYGIALINEYNNVAASNNDMSMDDLFRFALADCGLIIASPEFKNASIYLGEYGGFDGCHDLTVIFPASTPKEEFFLAVKRLDQLAYTSVNEHYKEHSAPQAAPERNDLLSCLEAHIVRITETSSRDVIIFAESPIHASEIAEELCNDDTIQIGYENYSRNNEVLGLASAKDLELYASFNAEGAFAVSASNRLEQKLQNALARASEQDPTQRPAEHGPIRD